MTFNFSYLLFSFREALCPSFEQELNAHYCSFTEVDKMISSSGARFQNETPLHIQSTSKWWFPQFSLPFPESGAPCSSTSSMPTPSSQKSGNRGLEKYTSGPRFWNVPVLVNTGTFLVYQYCLKMWYLRSLECAVLLRSLQYWSPKWSRSGILNYFFQSAK